jgi:hypothetical protein
MYNLIFILLVTGDLEFSPSAQLRRIVGLRLGRPNPGHGQPVTIAD